MRTSSWLLRVDQDGTEKDTMGTPNLTQVTRSIKTGGSEMKFSVKQGREKGQKKNRDLPENEGSSRLDCYSHRN